MSKARMNLGLAVGVLGVLVLIGADADAAEPRRKIVDCEGYTYMPQSLSGSSQRKVAQSAPQRAGFFRSVSGLQAETEVVEGVRRGPGLASPKSRATGRFSVGFASQSTPGTQPTASSSHKKEIDLESWASLSHPWTTFAPAQRDAAHGGFVAAPRNPAAAEGVTIAVEPLERVSASAGSSSGSEAAQDGNTIYVSTQWVPSSGAPALEAPMVRAGSRLRALSDISQMQQVDINR